MASRLTVLAKGAYRFLPALRLSVVALAFAGGCQNDGELANRNDGLAQSLAPRSVDDHSRKRNISSDQARRELQDAASKRDAENAVRNVDEIGVTTPPE